MEIVEIVTRPPPSWCPGEEEISEYMGNVCMLGLPSWAKSTWYCHLLTAKEAVSDTSPAGPRGLSDRRCQTRSRLRAWGVSYQVGFIERSMFKAIEEIQVRLKNLTPRIPRAFKR